MKINHTQLEELKSFRVVTNKHYSKLMPNYLFENSDLLFSRLHKRIIAPNDKVLASMWMRRYAFLLTAQLFMYSKYRLYWTGLMTEINVYDQYQNGRWLPTFNLTEDQWELSFNAEVTLQHMLYNNGFQMVQLLHEKTDISRRILWENIWSYIVWMYSNKLLSNPLDEKKARHDLDLLLSHEVWRGIEGYSPFKQFVGDQQIDDLLNQFERQTCCLYLKTPDSGGTPCPYCPKLKVNRSS
ncbi:hypothetical protein [Alkalibacillus silvisoli]|uniref:Aerobactin siderophore biosynthesis IucA/IucC-like C-terminal domain-containing protein n=1 Tax=Alkalibacillus silvisoli TaxID=392823 RepID=A0ABP3JIA0_9BACI